MATSWIMLKKPDVSMTGNGILAGLVAICSGIGDMNHWGTLVTAAIAGMIVVLCVAGVERLRVDDTVGAFSVHGVCGLWGLVATGLFATTEGTNGAVEGLLAGGGVGLLLDQLIGGVIIVAFVAPASGLMFIGLRAMGLLRASPDDEINGLDFAEHGVPGYGPEVQASVVTRTSRPLALRGQVDQPKRRTRV